MVEGQIAAASKKCSSKTILTYIHTYIHTYIVSVCVRERELN